MSRSSAGEGASDGLVGLTAQDLFPLVYDELRGLAALYMRNEQGDHELQPTALVHEIYLRLASSETSPWKTKSEFIAIAATAMRRVLVEHARKRDAAKRGGGQRPLSIDTRSSGLGITAASPDIDVIVLHEALQRLEVLHPRQGRLVELRIFGGLPVEEAATLMSVAASTAYKDWEMARAWLLRELGG